MAQNASLEPRTRLRDRRDRHLAPPGFLRSASSARAAGERRPVSHLKHRPQARGCGRRGAHVLSTPAEGDGPIGCRMHIGLGWTQARQRQFQIGLEGFAARSARLTHDRPADFLCSLLLARRSAVARCRPFPTAAFHSQSAFLCRSEPLFAQAARSSPEGPAPMPSRQA